MKNKIIRKKPYKKLIRKIFLQTLLIVVIAVTAVLIIRSAGRGVIGNVITEGIQRYFDLSWDDSLLFYQRYIRNNIESIIMAVILFFFILLYRFSLTWFTKYMDAIIVGVDKLSEEPDNKIRMISELAFVEDKLNEVNDKLKNRKKAAKAAEQRKNDLVVYLAHDIKTPLTSIIGYLSLLDEEKELTQEQREKFTHISLEKAYRLEQLINEFFEITRYNFKDYVVEKQTLDLYYMLIQIADEAYPQVAAQEKQIVIHAPEDLSINGDPNKLARVFNNILKNAIAYSDAGSKILITASVENKSVFIRFQNKGSIPKEELNHIFEKFYRLDSARSTRTGGAGLGLAIAKDIIEQHGGTVAADSDGINTVFTIRIPCEKTAGV